MRVAILSREYPPEVYGGAGVHVEYLARELAKLIEVEVHCFGAPREATAGGPEVHAYQPWSELSGAANYLGALKSLSVNLAMAAGVGEADLVHSHTWYANMGGHLSGLTHGIPHVVSVHSLEPLRPWKVEQLGGGYEVSKWAERTAIEAADRVIAVSKGMREDILACYPAVDPARVDVVYNGIDAAEYTPDRGSDALERYGIDPDKPSIVFVGRITRQKGVPHLLDAALEIDPAAQIVLCAGAPDTPEIGAEVAAKVDKVKAQRGNIVWIEKMLPKPEVIQILSNATVFVCPSVYEPLGIVNLEAMACETAVVASATGGIPEVVDDGATGLLVPFASDGAGGAAEPEQFAADIAERVNALVGDPGRAATMGAAGRRRVLDHFSWSAIAEQTAKLYEDVLRARG